MSLKEKLDLYRLNQDEYKMICEKLGREPQGIEWALFSSLWSEHCSYKSSKRHLKKLFREGPRVLESFGENAGVIDLGQGERIAFKMESHNHPSFIEPYQGAATGVGGILRDIFTMGARPLALANYLCFGDLDAPRMTTLVDGVVRGIGGYGNCVGVPTITGQTEFHSSYNGNILVNAFALGYFGKNDGVFLSKAKGIGFDVVYVGAKTGRDGIHGASMASESFEDGDESKRPTVQIGDPFLEKLLIESCIEVMNLGLVDSIQDMGAAGLTSSSFEMASKGQVGLDLELDKVPLRDSTLTPEDILLSESQERMLLICEPQKVDSLKEVFLKWGLDATVIGKVKEERKVSLFWNGDRLAEIDPDILVEEAPEYDRNYDPWDSLNKKEKIQFDSEKINLEELKSYQGSTRSWIYDQYDQRVGANTARDCSGSIGVIQLPESGRALGIVLGCRPHVMRHDAWIGGADAILYPSIELSIKGFEPLAVTDCLNFGNPEQKSVMSEFVASLEGLNLSCQKMKTPIISGNVSFYNESNGDNITSTPSTGLVGLRDSLSYIPADRFQEEGSQIILIECPQVLLSGMRAENKGRDLEFTGELNVQEVSRWCEKLKEMVLKESPLSTRIVGKFGLSYALSRMSMDSVSANCNLNEGEFSGEKLYQVLVEVKKSKSEVWINKMDARVIGETQATGVLVLNKETQFQVSELRKLYKGGLSDVMGAQ